MNILLTSAGRRSYIVDYFKKTRGVDKVYASNSEYSIALQCADGYCITPLIYSSEYIPFLLKFCQDNDIRIVMSLFDIDLLVLARHKKEFKELGIDVIVADEDFIEICNDKWKTYEFLNRNELLTPLTYLHLEDLLEALSKGVVSYPIMIKPRWGMASLGIYQADNEEELRVLTKKCYNDIFKSYLKYESSSTMNEAIIFQEKLEGKEYGLDVLNDLEGNYVASYAKQKVRMRSGETDLGRTVNIEPFKYLTRRIAEESKHCGLLSVDCFITGNGVYVTEMNCRISGHYPIAYLAGFNYPQILVDMIEGKMLNPENLRYLEDVYVAKDLNPMVLRNK